MGQMSDKRKRPRKEASIFRLRLHDGRGIFKGRTKNMSQILTPSLIFASKYLLTYFFRRTPPVSSELVSVAGKKRPVSCRHTLKDEVDDTSALLSIKSKKLSWWVETKAFCGCVNALIGISVIIGNCFNHGYGEQVEIDHPWNSYVLEV